MLVATAGHIDHGKTSLVRALTGVDTDRLPEERARGISIDLGFAYWRPDEDGTIGFVDVPGHERFVRNMLAGVGGIDLALLVVAADDGVMPQTVEHVQILDLLGISRAIIAITKCDRASRERIDAVRAQTEALLSNTTFTGAPTFEVSTINNTGILELGNALRGANAVQASRHHGGRAFRLTIDRAFSVTGIGTVVTGTVLNGAVKVGERLRTAPAGFDVRVRGLQTGSKNVDVVTAGERCAVNLAGIEKGQVRRGNWLITSRMDAPTSRLEARLRILSTREHALQHYTPVHFHLGTADVEARVLTARQNAIPPGGEGVVSLALDSSVIAATGDRFVLRDQSARTTIGGGVIIDPFLGDGRRNYAARASISAALGTLEPAQALAALFRIPGQEVRTKEFEQRFNLEPVAAQALYDQTGAVLLGTAHRLALPASRVTVISAQIVQALAASHQTAPELEGLSSRDLKAKLSELISSEAFMSLLQELHEKKLVVSSGPMIKLPNHKAVAAPGDQSLWHTLLPWLQERGAAPFTALELAQEVRTNEAIIIALLHRKRSLGEVWRITEERYLLRDQVATLAARAEVLNRQVYGTGFTAAQYRDAIGTGRTWAIQILEFFDSLGVTKRFGNFRKIHPDYPLIVGSAEPYSPDP